MPPLVLQREPTTAGEDTDAGRVLNNFARIEALVNGNLDDDNASVDSPVVVVTTLSGLATRRGKQVRLRAGTSPYEIIGLTWDEEYGKWVSGVQTLTQQNAHFDSGGTLGPIDAADVGGAAGEFPFAWIPNFKVLYDASLRPQLRLSGWLGPDGTNLGGFSRYIIEFREGAEGDTALVALGSVSVAGGKPGLLEEGVREFVFADWQEVAVSAPADTHVLAVPRLEFAAGGPGSCHYDYCEAKLRWVSA